MEFLQAAIEILLQIIRESNNFANLPAIPNPATG
jgi:hypothetical protein